jgi:hypothetical protein
VRPERETGCGCSHVIKIHATIACVSTRCMFVESIYYSCIFTCNLIRDPDTLTDLWVIDGELTFKTEGFGAQFIVAWIRSRVKI